MQEITIRKPDDWHLHVRDGNMMKIVLPFTAKRFARAIIMPNLKPPITTVVEAIAYRARIIEAMAHEHTSFAPLMTVYLTNSTETDEVMRGFEERAWIAAKLYPAGATTNSEDGVTAIRNIYPVLEVMQEIGMPLLVHGEKLHYDDGSEVDIFDRETVFIETILIPLLEKFPKLKIVLEHITTQDAVSFVSSFDHTRLAATVTPHHLFINRNDLFEGGIRPDHYCLPIAKRERHRIALREAVTSGLPCFFLGTDSAPHPMKDKYAACGCAGIFNTHAGIELYTEVFEEEGLLENLEAFASLNGPRFYELPINDERITLVRHPWKVQAQYADIVPFCAGEEVAWRIIAG